jgi:hypothetical protein
MIKKNIQVKKASGKDESFTPYKLENSLLRAGADIETSSAIVKEIEEWIYDGVSTKQIYARAFSLLRPKKIAAALRYKVKQAILELGPSGYPFEIFIGKIFEKQGYSVQVGQILEGYCITHEMDVIATKENIQCLVECKFSSDEYKHINVHVPLYVRSRVDDIIKKRINFPEYQSFSFSGWVVTNKRFSQESIDYGKCSGLNLLGWDYPKGYSLSDLIERLKIYPITILNHLTKKEKQLLINQGIVTCSQILLNPEVLDKFGLTKKTHDVLLKEISDICN